MNGVLHAVHRQVLHRLAALPPRAQVRLAGDRHPGGQALDPTIALILAAQRRGGLAGSGNGGAALVRDRVRRQHRLTGGARTPVAAIRDLTVSGAAGALPARLYRPGAAGLPLLVFFHGGGFVSGDLDSYEEPCRLLCRYADVNVLSVAYRLAPEHPFPAAVDDACTALSWAYRYAADLGADPARVAVGGEGAGANLATVAALLAARTGRRTPAAQVLLYPPTDHHSPWQSRRLFGDGLLLTAADVEWCHGHYAGGSRDPDDIRHSPLRARDLSGMPPTVLVTAAVDPVRDEAEAYARALRAAGTTVVSWRVPGMVHGFLTMTALSRAAREAAVTVAGTTRALLTDRTTDPGASEVDGFGSGAGGGPDHVDWPQPGSRARLPG